MRVNRKPTGRAAAVPVGLGWGLLTSAAITLLGCLFAAHLINREILAWNHSGYGVMAILLLSAWAGAAVSAGKIKRRRAVMCLGAGTAYFLMLMAVTALFFGGQYSGVGETGLMIFCGSMLGVLTGIREKRGRNTPKFRGRNC